MMTSSEARYCLRCGLVHDSDVKCLRDKPITDDLRTRIKQAIDQAHKSTHPHSTYDDWLGFAADAVIAALAELTQPVSAEAIGDYRYVCHPCGSSFSFYSSSTMQQFALLHSGSHNPKEDDD